MSCYARKNLAKREHYTMNLKFVKYLTNDSGICLPAIVRSIIFFLMLMEILFSGGKSAADMPLGLIHVQYLACLSR